MDIADKNTFIGGHRALDFINTVDDQNKQREINKIADWDSFLAWAQASSMVKDDFLKVLKNDIASGDKESLLLEIQELKEITYAALKFLLCAHKGQNLAMQTLQGRIKKAIENSSLENKGNNFKWIADTGNVGWILDLITLSIENLLCHEDLSKLRQCKRCTWMFLNSGRGKGRQWCSMGTCGNRAKSASFRVRNH